MERVEGFRRRALVACAAAFAVGLMGLAGEANAQFDELIPTKVGLVKFAGSPAVGKLYKLVSKAPNPPLFLLPSADPAATGGSVAVGISPGRLDCTLAAQAYDGIEGWKTLGPPATPKGYKYINNLAPGGIAGPCKMILVKQKVIKVITKGTGGLPAPVGLSPSVDTVLTLGGDDYCAQWVAPHDKEIANKLIKDKNRLAPVACPVIPSTTTTLPGTTTTTGGATTTTTGGETTTTTGGETTTTTTTLPPQPLDHYRLYPALGLDGPLVHIEDQFHPGSVGEDVDLGRAEFFLVPADKNGEGIINPADHLTCYDIPEGSFSAMVTVSNQFDDLGPQYLEVYNPDALCVPTEKNPMPPGQPLMRDHYKCYGAAGSPVFRSVTLMDQFQDAYVMVLHPILFCNPADKNGEGIVNQIDHLTCYATDPPGLIPPMVTIRNQFHQQGEYLELGPSLALCVPGKKIGWTPVTTTTTTQETTTTAIVDTTTTTTTSTPTTTLLPPPPCEQSLPPACDGACPPGTECVQAGPLCVCELSIAVCGDGQFGPPLCWGSCPPEAPICRDMGGMCVCTPY